MNSASIQFIPNDDPLPEVIDPDDKKVKLGDKNDKDGDSPLQGKAGKSDNKSSDVDSKTGSRKQ